MATRTPTQQAAAKQAKQQTASTGTAKTAAKTTKTKTAPTTKTPTAKKKTAKTSTTKTAPAKTAPAKTAPAKTAPVKTAKTAPEKKRAGPRLAAGEEATKRTPLEALAAVREGPRPRVSDGPHSGKYVYCIVGADEPLHFGRIGIGAEPADVHSIHHGTLAAVVSDAPIKVYDPTRENVLAHEHVNEVVMRDRTVIPMSFGTVFNTGEDIVELLRTASGAFRDVLDKMEHKLEFGLKVMWDREQVIRGIEEQDENVRRLKSEIASEKGSTYFARMQYGRVMDELLLEHSNRCVSEIFSSLRDVCVGSRVNNPIGEKMIVNGAFLVSREMEAEFDARVRAIGARLNHLTFTYTGPWPPYNFVSIRLKLERAGDGPG